MYVVSEHYPVGFLRLISLRQIKFMNNRGKRRIKDLYLKKYYDYILLNILR